MSLLKPYIVLVGDQDYVVAAQDFIENSLPGFTLFVALNAIEAIQTMDRLDRPAIFVVGYDLPDVHIHDIAGNIAINGLSLIEQNIRKTFRFDSFCIVVTDNVEAAEKVSKSRILCCRKSNVDEISSGRKRYILDQFFIANINYAVEHLKELHVDPLTRLLTYSAAMKRWKRDFEAACRQKTSTGFLLGDVNDLKWINDTYGHLAADLVIQTIGTVFRQCSRDPYDYASRLGCGDEFGLFLPFANKDGVKKALNRIEKLLSELHVEVKKDVFISPMMSFGTSVLKPGSLGHLETDAYKKMFEEAERMMYRNKLVHYEKVVAEQPKNEQAANKLEYYKRKKLEKASGAIRSIVHSV